MVSIARCIYVLFVQPLLCFSMSTWLPVGSKSSLPKTPNVLKIANKDYVVWQNPKTKEWSILINKCSHRLAPLSKGRIDALTGNIECPYHGWQFSKCGKCTRIPQAKKNEIGKSVKSIPVMETGDVIWGKFDLENANYDKEPNKVFPELDNVEHIISRDLPYGFDYLVENFMDPAHIPFAHHGLQGIRSDGIHIPMNIITSNHDSSKVEVEFCDRIRGQMRHGVVSFISPAYYHFRTGQNKNMQQIQLLILITPVSSGNCRIHLAFINAKTPKFLPKWLSHSFANKFLETDIWLHDCEANVLESNSSSVLKAYDLPTSSDIGPKAWRKWYTKHMSKIPVYKPSSNIKRLSIRQQKSRWSHIETCMHCQNALKFSKHLNIGALIYPAFIFYITQNTLLSFCVFGALKTLSKSIYNLVVNDR